MVSRKAKTSLPQAKIDIMTTILISDLSKWPQLTYSFYDGIFVHLLIHQIEIVSTPI